MYEKSQNVSFSGIQLKEKATETLRQMVFLDFSLSNVWNEIFMRGVNFISRKCTPKQWQ